MTLELVNWMFFMRIVLYSSFNSGCSPHKNTLQLVHFAHFYGTFVFQNVWQWICSVCVWLFLAISSDFRARNGFNILKKDYEETYALCACSLYASAYHARICERNDLSVSTCAAGKTNGLSKQYFIVAAVAVVLYSSSKSLHIDSFSDLHWNDV